MRIYCLRVQKWDPTLDWTKNLKTTFHTTAKQDIQSIWIIFLRIMDGRSSQFNDRLVSICESLQPFPNGLQHSFVDHDEVIDSFFGKGVTPIDMEKNYHL